MLLSKDIIMLVIGWLFGVTGILLQSFLTQRQAKKQSLIETRRAVYAKLLSATISEFIYPEIYSGNIMSEDDRKQYNERLLNWRSNRKTIKGLAAEALLLTENLELRKKLTTFISSNDPHERLRDEEQLMRNEIGL